MAFTQVTGGDGRLEAAIVGAGRSVLQAAPVAEPGAGRARRDAADQHVG